MMTSYEKHAHHPVGNLKYNYNQDIKKEERM